MQPSRSSDPGQQSNTPAFHRPTFLMCPPTHYDVHYVINPWMEGNVRQSSHAVATEQWNALYATLTRLAHIELATPALGSPDMVFAANAGLVHEEQVVLSRFLHPERQGEEEHFRDWFRAAGLPIHELDASTPFEGEGDALFTPAGDRLWAGWGWRTSLESHAALGRFWPGVQVCSLRLVDPRFYHLDTCFCPLSGGELMYFPPAFDQASLDQIERFYPPEQRLAISEADAIRFACNAVNIGRSVVLNQVSAQLAESLGSRGYQVHQVALGEFMKAGGAAKCLTLRLSELAATHQSYPAVS